MTRGKVGRVALVAAALALAGGVVASAAADDTGTRVTDCTAVDYDTVGCTFTHAGGGTATPGGGTPGETPSPQPASGGVAPAADPNLVYSWHVQRDAAGRACWAPTGGSYETDPARRAQLQREADRAYLAQSAGVELPPCYPDGAASPATAAPAESTPAFLREAEIRQRLGSPAPRIQPGRAITGKTAYLEIAGVGPRTLPVADPLGGAGATVDARPNYRVDWGDGTITETSSAGGPWPRGDVTHVYQRTGHYDIVVTARWTTRWTAANGEGGEISGLTTEGRLPHFPVTEVQAVRER